MLGDVKKFHVTVLASIWEKKVPILTILLIIVPFSHSAEVACSNTTSASKIHISGEVFFIATGEHYRQSSKTLTFWIRIISESEIVECNLTYSYTFNNIYKGPFSTPMNLNSSTFENGKYNSTWTATISIPELLNYTVEIYKVVIFKDADGEIHQYIHQSEWYPPSATVVTMTQPLALGLILLYIAIFSIAPFVFVVVYIIRRKHHKHESKSTSMITQTSKGNMSKY